MTTIVSWRALASVPLAFAVPLAAGVAVYWWVTARTGDGLDALFPAFASIALVIAALWLAREGLYEAFDARAIAAIRNTSRKRGQWVAVAGKAVARGEVIKATLSDRPALACSYKIFEKRVEGRSSNRSLRMKLCYEGYHLAPTAIETTAGIVPLRGLPDLVNLEKSGVGAGGKRLQQVAEKRSWFPPRYAARAHLAAQIQDRFDIDWYYGESEAYHSVERREWVLPPDEMVCVFGRWDGKALVPHPLRPRGLPVYAGSVDEVSQRLRGGSKVFFALAAIALLAAVWLVYYFGG